MSIFQHATCTTMFSWFFITPFDIVLIIQTFKSITVSKWIGFGNEISFPQLEKILHSKTIQFFFLYSLAYFNYGFPAYGLSCLTILVMSILHQSTFLLLLHLFSNRARWRRSEQWSVNMSLDCFTTGESSSPASTQIYCHSKWKTIIAFSWAVWEYSFLFFSL